jgi:hypothetical protein
MLTRFRLIFISFGLIVLAALIGIDRICDGGCMIFPSLAQWIFWPVQAFFGLFTIRLDQFWYAIPAVYFASFLYSLILLFLLSLITEYVLKKVRK